MCEELASDGILLTKPEEAIKQSDDRTIAALPLEYDVKLQDVETFFAQYAELYILWLRSFSLDCGCLLKHNCQYINVDSEENRVYAYTLLPIWLFFSWMKDKDMLIYMLDVNGAENW